MNSSRNMNNKISLKWMKFKLLTIWDLREESELLSSIHRYSIREYEKCLRTIYLDMCSALEEYIYIVKMVCYSSVYKLPNYIINTREDIINLQSKIEVDYKSQFEEIWFCRNVKNSETIYGRVLFSLEEVLSRIGLQTLEVVWGNTARLIEQYPHLKSPYAAVEMDGWGRNYRIIDIIQADKSNIEIENKIVLIIELLYKQHKRIVDFGRFIHECGCSNLSIEFSFSSNGVFKIIDWDSDNDMRILTKIGNL